jgi:outer membrane protein assembly factor BamA
VYFIGRVGDQDYFSVYQAHAAELAYNFDQMEEIFKADAVRLARKGLLELFTTTCLFVFSAQALEAQQPDRRPETKYSIERIDTEGNRRVETAEMRACIISRPGDAYSPKTIRRDVQALRDTGFFEDVRLEVEDSPHQLDAKIVVFIVRERPIVRRVEYRGIKTITEPEIRNALNDKGVRLSVGDWFDQTKLARAALVINALLSARGSPSATVKATLFSTSTKGQAPNLRAILISQKSLSAPGAVGPLSLARSRVS